MSKKYLKVAVSGLPQSGKTVLAELIGDTLSKNGFDVIMETDELEDESPARQDAAVAALAKSGLQVMVQEKDAHRRAQKPKPKPAPPRKPEVVPFSGMDETIKCKGCKEDFLFSADEQEFFKNKGFDKHPLRCRGCRRKKKSRRSSVVAAAGS